MQIAMGNSESLPCTRAHDYNQQNAVLDVVAETNNNKATIQCIENDMNKNLKNSENVKDGEQQKSIVTKMNRTITNVLQHLVQQFEKLLFRKSLLISNAHMYSDNQQHNQHQRQQQESSIISRSTSIPGLGSSTRNGITLLRNCETVQQQYSYIKSLVETCRHLHGKDGLYALGLEYRMILCAEHKEIIESFDDVQCFECIDEELDDDCMRHNERILHKIESPDIEIDGLDNCNDEMVEGHESFVELAKIKSEKFLSTRSDSVVSDAGSGTSEMMGNGHTATSLHADICTTPSLGTTAVPYDLEDDVISSNTTNEAKSLPIENTSSVQYKNVEKRIEHRFCHLCARRLYDMKSDTPIDHINRKEYIADGEMYELASRFAQEYAQDVMIEEGNMEWVIIDDNNSINAEPIRMLISKDHPCRHVDIVGGEEKKANRGKQRPTVLVCTGRGKVRAGIFSRHHLLCTGLERSTAIPIVHEAIHRNLHVAIIDPNVNGESQGFLNFQKSMDYLKEHFDMEHTDLMTMEPCTQSTPTLLYCREMYILSHSASGGHLARYFLDKCSSSFIRNIKAIAFTDSTHSIQWAKGSHQTYLYDLLQSANCIYFRCSSSTRDTIAGDGDSKWYLHPAGASVQTDSFWRHRFGSIKTVWAGTNEHSMTNWYSHAKIWEHFDQFLFAINQD